MISGPERFYIRPYTLSEGGVKAAPLSSEEHAFFAHSSTAFLKERERRLFDRKVPLSLIAYRLALNPEADG